MSLYAIMTSLLMMSFHLFALYFLTVGPSDSEETNYLSVSSELQSAFRTLNDSSESALIMIFVQCMQNLSQDFFKLDNMSTCMIIVASMYTYI